MKTLLAALLLALPVLAPAYGGNYGDKSKSKPSGEKKGGLMVHGGSTRVTGSAKPSSLTPSPLGKGGGVTATSVTSWTGGATTVSGATLNVPTAAKGATTTASDSKGSSAGGSAAAPKAAGESTAMGSQQKFDGMPDAAKLAALANCPAGKVFSLAAQDCVPTDNKASSAAPQK